jgi:hypothetical protein
MKKNYVGYAWENKNFENSNPSFRISLKSKEIELIDKDVIKIALLTRKDFPGMKKETDFTHTVYENRYDDTRKPDFNANLFVNIPKVELLNYGADREGNIIIYASPKKEKSIDANKADYHVKTMINKETKETEHIKGAGAWSMEVQNRYFIIGNAKNVELKDKEGNKFTLRRLFLEKKELSKTQLTEKGYLNLSVQENFKGNMFVYRSVYGDENNLFNISIPENKIDELLNSNPGKNYCVLEIANKKEKENELSVSYYDYEKGEKHFIGNGWDMQNKRISQVEKLIDEAITRNPKTYEKFKESLEKNGVNVVKNNASTQFVHNGKWYDVGSFKDASNIMTKINGLESKSKEKEAKTQKKPKQKELKQKESKQKEPKQKTKQADKGMER